MFCDLRLTQFCRMKGVHGIQKPTTITFILKILIFSSSEYSYKELEDTIENNDQIEDNEKNTDFIVQ